MNNQKIYSQSLTVLANSINLTPKDILEVLENPTYKVFSIPKKSGGKRMIHAPIEKTKIVQNKIYRNFLKKIASGGFLSKYCFGGVPRKSTLDCLDSHSFLMPNFLIDVDLKDAFYCVDKFSLKKVLQDLFYNEIFLYKFRYEIHLLSQKNIESLKDKFNDDEYEVRDHIWDKISSFRKLDEKYFSFLDKKYNTSNLLNKHRGILFPNKLNKEFRQMIRNGDSQVYDICDEMAEILSTILTYDGRLVQGCPTSPILMALVLSHTKLISKFDKFLDGYHPKSFPENYTKISVYVDNITISVFNYSSKEKLSEDLRETLKEIEKTTIWKFNWKKIHVYEPKKEQPVLMGLRLVKNRKTKKELKNMVHGKIKGAKHALKAWEPWYYFKPTIPKNLQKKIRGIIHNATLNQNNQHTVNIARGYVGYVFYVYRKIENIPLQIRKPIEVFLNVKK